MAGAAAMGANVAFVGQVAADQLGTIFTHDMRALGVRFDTRPLEEGPPTGRCLILVTPDGERTMNTCPGAAHCLPLDAVVESAVRAASILYLEGYLFGPELSRKAMIRSTLPMRPSGRWRSPCRKACACPDAKSPFKG
jgi:sugar/nucleoside kinase (ribokinase family)